MHRHFSRQWNKLLSLSLCGALLSCTLGCDNAKTTNLDAATPGILVEVSTPTIGNLTRSTEFIGHVEPNELIRVLPKVSGTALKVHARVGDTVKAGDLLFEIDSADIALQLAAQQAEVDAAEAGVLVAQAQVEQALGSGYDMQVAELKAQIRAAQNIYVTARDNLKDYGDDMKDTADVLRDQLKTLEDSLPLLDDYAASAEAEYYQQLEALKKIDQVADPDGYAVQQQVVNAAEIAMEKAKRTVTVAENNIARCQQELEGTEERESDPVRKEYRTAVNNAQVERDNLTSIYDIAQGQGRSEVMKLSQAQLEQATAAFSAQVKAYEAASKQLEYTKIYAPIDGIVERCDVTNNAMIFEAEPAYVISNKQSLTAIFHVSADAVAQMLSGDAITVENNGQSYSGTITEVGSMTDPQSGLFQVKAVIEGGEELKTGTAIKVIAQTAKAQNSLLIPQSALYFEDGRGYVYVNQEGVAVKTFLELGVTNNELAEVLSGLTQDSELVVSWNPNLLDGVVINPAPQEDASSQAEEQAK